MTTLLVTGATDGIGFATAARLLQLGHCVLVHGRDRHKAESASNELAASVPASRAIPVWADFERMAEVVKLAEQVKTTADRLDVLINNAGIYPRERRTTDDGLELTMAVNYFAPFLLTRELLPVLEKSAAPRVVNVSSMTHQGATLDLDDLALEREWGPYTAYSTSKLANILFTRELARRSRHTALTTNALHPGVVGTKLLRQGFSMGGMSCEDGAKTSVFLATDATVARTSGEYFVACKTATASTLARDPRLAEQLWRVTEAHLNLR